MRSLLIHVSDSKTCMLSPSILYLPQGAINSQYYVELKKGIAFLRAAVKDLK